jgi:hypothetical protein
MNFRRPLGRLLAVFVIVGLIAAPLVTPAAAAKRLPIATTTAMAAISGDMATMSGDMATMSGDMPCCPDGQKKNNCHDCPLVAMCMLTIVHAVPASTDGVPASFQTRSLFFALVDLRADGLVGAPPDHPPRTSI